MTIPVIKDVPLTSLRVDGGTQHRAEISKESVSDYVDAMKSGVVLPPLLVMFDGKEYWLVDGFHRYHALAKIDELNASCEVRIGTKRDAVVMSWSVNANHGKQRTNKEKREIVKAVLSDKEYKEKKLREIAEVCAVSINLVSEVKQKLTAKDSTKKRKIQKPSPEPQTGSTPPTIGGTGGKPPSPESQSPQPLTPSIPEVLIEDVAQDDDGPEQETAEDELAEAVDTIVSLSEEVQTLKDIIMSGTLPKTERDDVLKELTLLRSKNKAHEANEAALRESRDQLMLENSEMKKQLERQRKVIQKLQGKK